MEHWKEICNYEGLYEVSDLGRVRRVCPTRNAPAGHVLSPSSNGGGYLCVGLYADAKHRHTHSVHVLVMRTFKGPPPSPRHTIDHKDMDKTNCRLDNLEYVLHAINVRRAWEKLKRVGRGPFGTGNHNAKLNPSIVRRIRKMYTEGMTHRKIGEEFGVSHTVVGLVLRGKTWTHVA